MDIPAKVDTGIAYIDESNIDEWKDIVTNGGSEMLANNEQTTEADN